MHSFKRKIKLLCKEGLYFLGTAVCTKIIYAFLKWCIIPFDEHLTDSNFLPIIVTILLGLVSIYIFTKLHVGWKYSIRGRGDNEVIRGYKDKPIGNIFEESKKCFRREAYFMFFVVLTATLGVIFEPLIYLVQYLYIFNDIMPRALGATASAILTVLSYFLNLYLYRRKVYMDFYVCAEKRKSKRKSK